uniref:Uncharacterized protein n=1 Tax=Onchocerca volvulus TaxID=6282 RepID=A0A8R1TQQ2_ONCVO
MSISKVLEETSKNSKSFFSCPDQAVRIFVASWMCNRRKEGSIKILLCWTAPMFFNASRYYRILNHDKERQVWDEFINYIETKHDALMEEPTEYNNIKLLERLEANPELMEVMNKAEKATNATAMDDSFELATKIEKQFFSLIPRVTGLTVYRNVMINEIARDESTTVTI